MAFCNNCGSELPDGSKFCHVCGHEVETINGGQTQRQQVFEGNVHKCPNCGEIVPSFQTNCPTCGFEFRDAFASNAIKEFAKKLEEIESGTNNGKKGLSRAFSRISGDVNRQRLNLIQSFAVPNTKEDLIEFMILAVSNIDTASYGIVSGTGSAAKRSDAWYSKIKQVYEKARVSFGNEAEFQKIEELYKKCVKEIRRQKTKRVIKAFFLYTLPIWLFALLFVIVKLGSMGGQ